MMDRTKTNDVAELTKLSLKTFLNIGQMARYRYLYTYGKELRKDCPAQINAYELVQNRDKIVPMQPGDVPTTYADATALERDFGFTPKITLREGLRKFAEWYAEFYGTRS